MTTVQPRSRPTVTRLAQHVGTDPTVAQVADWVAAAWKGIDLALTPIIGQRGVAGLCRRSLHVTSIAYPWLASLKVDSDARIDPDALKSVLVLQTSSDAAAGGTALLQTFYDLLITLVGPTLTEQLLHPVWATPSLNGSLEKDAAP